jgi:ADP-ribose pyrophosphatase YjhB (NUDIX family)
MANQFCLQCGTPLIAGIQAGRERQYCPSCGFILFRNPAPVAMAVTRYEGKFLLVNRTIPPLKNYWAPPAGYIEIGESVTQAAVREAKEETGVDVELGELIGVYSHPEVKVVLIAYRANATSGSPKAGDDAGAVALFDRFPDQPPPDPEYIMDYWFYEALQQIKETLSL